MPLPQLNTAGIDVSGTLNRIAAQEQMRQARNEDIAFREKQANEANELRRMQIQNLQEERVARREDRESLNALRQHQANKQEAEVIKMYSDIFTNGINRIGSLDEANRFLGWARKSGLPEEALPDDFKTWEDFEKFKVRSNAAVAGLQKGNWDYVTVYGPDGKTKRVPVEKNKLFDPEEEFGKGWSLVQPKQKESTKEVDYIKDASTIMLHADTPDLVLDHINRYNQKAPGHNVFVVETDEGWTVPFTGWKGGKDVSKVVRKTLPKVNGKQLSKEDVLAFAESRSITFEQALERIMKYSENKTKEPAKKSVTSDKTAGTTRSY